MASRLYRANITLNLENSLTVTQTQNLTIILAKSLIGEFPFLKKSPESFIISEMGLCMPLIFSLVLLFRLRTLLLSNAKAVAHLYKVRVRARVRVRVRVRVE
jgi:hypothetical protein